MSLQEPPIPRTWGFGVRHVHPALTHDPRRIGRVVCGHDNLQYSDQQLKDLGFRAQAIVEASAITDPGTHTDACSGWQ